MKPWTIMTECPVIKTEKAMIIWNKNSAMFKKAVSMVPQGVPAFLIKYINASLKVRAGDQAPCIHDIQEVDFTITKKKDLILTVVCGLDYRGVQAVYRYQRTTSMSAIKSFYSNEVKIADLTRLIQRRLRQAASAIAKEVPAQYPSLIHGDKNFEKVFQCVTYQGFEDRNKRSDGNRFLHSILYQKKESVFLSETKDAVTDTVKSIFEDYTKKTSSSVDCGPISVNVKEIKISNSMEFGLKAEFSLGNDKTTTVKTILALPGHFRFADADSAKEMIREGLPTLRQDLISKVSEVVNKNYFKETKPVVDKEQKKKDDALCKGHHEATDRHVLVVEADMTRREAMRIFELSEHVRKLKNFLVAMYKPKLEAIQKDEQYRQMKKQYASITKQMNAADSKIDECETLKQKQKKITDGMSEIQTKYGLSLNDVRLKMQKYRARFHVPGVFGLTAAEDIWRAISSVLFEDGEDIHFLRYGILPELRAKQPDRMIICHLLNGGLWFDAPLIPTKKEREEEGAKRIALAKANILKDLRKKQKDGEVLTPEDRDVLSGKKEVQLSPHQEKEIRTKVNHEYFQTVSFGPKIKQGDRFVQDEIDQIVHFLSEPNADLNAARRWADTKKPQDTFRICYASLVCQRIRKKFRVFIHIMLEGRPCLKYKKNGDPRHTYGTGRVGIDIGTQSIATVSEKAVKLENLSERNGKSSFDSEKKQGRIMRYMDRSRRMNNPENYNQDGTIKKGKKTWKNSKSYKRAARYNRDLERKNARNREYSINEKAWTIRAEASVVIIEPSNAKAWQASGKAKRRREKKKAEEAAKLQNTQQAKNTVAPVTETNTCNTGQEDSKKNDGTEGSLRSQNAQQTDSITSPTADNKPDNAGQKDLKEKKEKEEVTQQAENTASPTDNAKPENKEKNFKRKKRKTGFGHSIKNRCPGKQQQKIKQVFESTRGEYHTVDKNFRASQYDHELDEYIKKELSQRIHLREIQDKSTARCLQCVLGILLI